MPFLNMCELSSQKEMKHRLPILYRDMKEGNIDCLSDFKVEWNRINIDDEKPESELGTFILDQMVKQAGEGLRIQRGREYGFFGEEFNERAADITQIPDAELELIPSHNLDCERNLSVAGVYMEVGSKCSNRHFKARCVRDNVTLHQSSEVKKIERELQSLLDQREKDWYQNQKQLGAQHLEGLIIKGKNRDNLIDKVLTKCKSWNGPFLTIDELKLALANEEEDRQRKILRHEITFQRATHKSDALVRKELYLINKQSIATMTYNLGVLLSGDRVREENDGEIFLPTEDDVLAAIDKSAQATVPAELQLKINELCAVVWDHRGKLNWYLGFVLAIGDLVKVEHLERTVSTNDTTWQYPLHYTDIQDVEKEQILPIDVESEWDHTDPEKSVLNVNNVEDIIACFVQFI